MKHFAVLVALLSAVPAFANSFPVEGAPADALVDSLVRLGFDAVGTHEYFQIGVTACAEVFDEKGGYFPGGAAGDYVGEECMIYGDADGTDEDGVLRAQVSIPADDRELTGHPEIRAKLEGLKAVRLAMEALVTPLVRKATVDGREIVAARTTGILGVACEGRNARGERTCRVLPSSHCPPRP